MRLIMPNERKSRITAPELARKWGVAPEKIRFWILTGELKAIDASTKLGGRPRYLIDLADIEAFERKRAIVKQTEPKAKRKAAAPTKRYF
jgi:hypothetical protein